MGKVYITGDVHGDFFGRFGSTPFPEGKELCREDYVIVLGDFGIWHDTPTERYALDWLEGKSFTVLFCDGNHENYDRLYHDFPEIDFMGGRAHKIRENIYHLMRGYVFDICGKKFFCFGGASSHDIQDGIVEPSDFKSTDEMKLHIKMKQRRGEIFRVNHLSWWKEEMPSFAERNRGYESLIAVDYKVDYVISHCCPHSIETEMSYGMYKGDELTRYFDELLTMGLEFKHWFYGHYHVDRDYYCKYHARYEKIERII